VAPGEAVSRLAAPRTLDHPGWVALAGVIGFAGNELVAGYRIRTGRRIGSAALVADGHHARTDGLTSLAVVIAALGAMAGWPLADPVVRLVISVAILNVPPPPPPDSYPPLSDRLAPTLVAKVARARAPPPGVQAAAGPGARWIGHDPPAAAEVPLAPTLALAAAHAALEDARPRLLPHAPRL